MNRSQDEIEFRYATEMELSGVQGKQMKGKGEGCSGLRS